MMSVDKLVTLRRCGPVWEAEMLRDRLEAAGIRAFVQNAESIRSLSHAAAGLGGVKVQVAAEDLETAEQILLDDERQRATAGSWQCPRCGEMNDPAFDFCWNCSMPRGEAAETQPEITPEQVHDPSEGIARDDLFVDPLDRPRETSNPYQPLDPYRRSSSDRLGGLGDQFDDFEQREGLGIVPLLTLLILAAVILYMIVTLAEVFVPN